MSLTERKDIGGKAVYDLYVKEPPARHHGAAIAVAYWRAFDRIPFKHVRYSAAWWAAKAGKEEARLAHGRLPVRAGVMEVAYHRRPTPAETRFGYGATHYRTFPVEDVCHPGTRILKKWFIAADDGLRYSR